MSIKVTLPYDPVWAPLNWAKKHCPSYITNDLNSDINPPSSLSHDDVFFQYYPELQQRIDYFFSDKEDAFKFALRWL